LITPNTPTGASPSTSSAINNNNNTDNLINNNNNSPSSLVNRPIKRSRFANDDQPWVNIPSSSSSSSQPSPSPKLPRPTRAQVYGPSDLSFTYSEQYTKLFASIKRSAAIKQIYLDSQAEAEEIIASVSSTKRTKSK
jgi:hypothetical protein